MIDYAERVAINARRLALGLLAEAPDYRLNEAILRDMLARLGVSYFRADVQALLRWLEGEGLLGVEDIDGLFIATITPAGLDVAEGRARHPGVKRPGPH